MIDQIVANQAIVSNADFCKVEHRAVVVCMEIFTHMDILAEVTMEVVTHKRIDANGAEQLIDDFLFLWLISQSQPIQLLGKY